MSWKDIKGEPLRIGDRVAYATGTYQKVAMKLGVIIGTEYPKNNKRGEPMPYMVRVRVDLVSTGATPPQNDLVSMNRMVKLQ